MRKHEVFQGIHTVDTVGSTHQSLSEIFIASIRLPAAVLVVNDWPLLHAQATTTPERTPGCPSSPRAVQRGDETKRTPPWKYGDLGSPPWNDTRMISRWKIEGKVFSAPSGAPRSLRGQRTQSTVGGLRTQGPPVGESAEW